MQKRYDLLCLEGIAKAFRVFLEKDKAPEFVKTPKQLSLTVEKAVKTIQKKLGKKRKLILFDQRLAESDHTLFVQF